MSKTTEPRRGSRDKVRSILEEIKEKGFQLFDELEALKASDKKNKLSYRYTEIYVGNMINSAELASLVMRKRKRATPTAPDVVPEVIDVPVEMVQ